MMEMEISQTGMASFNGMIVHLKAEIPAMMQRAAMAAATITTESARPTIPRDSGDAARSLRHFLTNSGGAQVEGGSTIDYYRWLELGGASGRNLTNKRPLVEDGRYIYPAYLRNAKRVEQIAQEELTKTVNSAGLEAT